MSLSNANGHELVRGALVAMLQAKLPGRLAVVRSALGVSGDILPDPMHYGLDERWPKRSDWPAIVVPSTELVEFSVEYGDATIDVICTYSVQVAVGCRVDEHNATDAAAVQRDRLLLALRDTLIWNRRPHPRVEVFLQGLREEAGTPAPEIVDRPQALGVVSFLVRTQESAIASPAEPTAVEASVDLTPVVTPIESLEA